MSSSSLTNKKAVVLKKEPLKKKNNDKPTEEILDTGIRLGGIWRDTYNKICTLENEIKNNNENILMLCEDRNTLIYDRINMTKTFKYTLTSLSDTELSHLQAQQIINHVLGEKHSLDSRCNSLLSQRDWLENERFQLRSQLLASENLITDNCKHIQTLEESLNKSLQDNIELKKQLSKRDDSIEVLKNDIISKDDEIRVLKKSLETKDRQLQVLVKERNRSQDDLDRLRKSLRPRERNPVDENSPETPKDSRISTPNMFKSPSKSYDISPNGVNSLQMTPETPNKSFDSANILSKLQEIQDSMSPNKEKQYHRIIKKLQFDLAQAKLRTGIVNEKTAPFSQFNRTKVDAPSIAIKLFSPEKIESKSNPW